LVIGGSYADDRGCEYIYLGKGSVYSDHDDKFLEGYIYLYSLHDYNSETDIFTYLPCVNVLKNPRKLIKEIDPPLTSYQFIKNEFTLISEHRRFTPNRTIKRTLKFKLEGLK